MLVATNGSRQKIAVVGAGISGISAAYLLAKKHDVVLYEKQPRIGGHTNTVVLDSGPNAGLAVDTGFIVLNDRTYPIFEKLLALWGVETRPSDMSFSFWCERSNLYYNGTTLRSMFVQKRNLFKLSFWRMLRDIVRFNKEASTAVSTNNLPGCSLGEWLGERGFGREMVEDYLIPMGAAIWSTPPKRMMEYPAATLLRFFSNHGLLSISDRPQWKTVVGGSHSYLRAFEKQFKGEIVVSADIQAIVRPPDQRPQIRFGDGRTEDFDVVVLAAHADQSLRLLADADDLEQELLGPWAYEHNRTVLHTDEQCLPPRKGAWASWNYVRENNGAAADNPSTAEPLPWIAGADASANQAVLTYHMNRLQGFTTREQYCVTLNAQRTFRADSIVKEIDYEHPQYTLASIGSQARLSELQGRRGTYFCGAYFGYGFHEDGAKSGVRVAEALGCPLE